ncbi:hypothetical protein VST7929_00139 [Vibrio stylophorae]|uniref:Diguanylate cyclase n=1 Tax=Vibrio stylophorae TaxID=659351 RepID=A0ABM8ZPU9_9VIBR|nr:EAL domain-containing protein [Vibrio stylophorae]CAH0532321.1 hypothetical protein VST7929_00139 [Vibrio stylophorae]
MTHRGISLKQAIVFPVALLMALIIAILTYIEHVGHQQLATEISQKMLKVTVKNTETKLDAFLDAPFQANRVMADSIRHIIELHPANDLEDIQSYLLQAYRKLFVHLPQMSAMGFGDAQGNYVGFRKENDEQLTLLLKDRRSGFNLIGYQGIESSDPQRFSINRYDPRQRPWYLVAKELGKSTWSSIYFNVDEHEDITITTSTPIYLNDKLVGVTASDIQLEQFNQKLREQQRELGGLLYIMDDHGKLIAQSMSGSITTHQHNENLPRRRIYAQASKNPIIQTSAQFVANQDDRYFTDHFQFTIDGVRYYGNVFDFGARYGLNWKIITIFSTDDLLQQIPDMLSTTLVSGALIAIAGLIIGLVIVSRITDPIIKVSYAARSLARGVWKQELQQPSQIRETNMLVNAFNEMSQKLHHSFNQLRQQLLFDHLTGLPTREGLIEHVQRNPYRGQVTLVLIGLNSFRTIKDSLGHLIGDQLLLEMQQRLQQNLPAASELARVGGDEFAICLFDDALNLPSEGVIQSLVQLFNTPFVLDQQEEILITARFGIYQTEQTDQSDVPDWLNKAGLALTTAKQPQSAGIERYHAGLSQKTVDETRMLSDMRQALRRNEFSVFFQPVVNAQDETVTGAEALVRWHCPRRGLVSPAQFIPLAESSGMIIDLGYWILEDACRQVAKKISQEGWRDDFNLHVNLCVTQLGQKDFISQLQAILQRSGLPAKNLTLEITESRLMTQDLESMQVLHQIRELGIGLAIDDFGTGYSSLAYLNQLPFSCLKIDRSFISQLGQDKAHQTIVNAVINMSQGFQCQLVAEGVETAEQRDILRELGCQSIQGFFYAKPAPFTNWPQILVAQCVLQQNRLFESNQTEEESALD